jgi:ornithine cyclodeaminase/alanine dehydrogenase-like protein (mu-crystallin family)
MARGDVELPPKPGIHPRENAFIHAMPAYLRAADVAALKWVSGYPSNKDRGLPYISGLIVVNDPDTGLPCAILDAAEITAARTAAASGVCIRRFAPSGWRTAALLGCGEQGRYHALVLAALNPSVAIRAYDPDPASVERLPVEAEAAADPRDAVRGAEVVITAGPIVEAPTPPITADWLADEHLLLPIDFDFYVHADAIAAADLFVVDDVDQFESYRSQGHFGGWRPPDGSTGEALSWGGAPARAACVNLGVGALDAAFAGRVLGEAARAGVGVTVRL